MIDRRVMLAMPLALLAACKGGGAAKDASGLEAEPDMHLGDPKAKVKMVEYQSVACPVCAEFNNTVFGDFRKKYIDTGRVYYTSREALTHDPALAAAGFLVAHCAGKDKYFGVVDTIFKRQAELEAPGADVRGILLEIGRSAGVTEAQFTACVNDETALGLIQKRWDAYANGESKSGTPTILINGKQVNPAMADLEAAVLAAEK